MDMKANARLSKRCMVGGQEDMIVDVALDLLARRESQGGRHRRRSGA